VVVHLVRKQEGSPSSLRSRIVKAGCGLRRDCWRVAESREPGRPGNPARLLEAVQAKLEDETRRKRGYYHRPGKPGPTFRTTFQKKAKIPRFRISCYQHI